MTKISSSAEWQWGTEPRWPAGSFSQPSPASRVFSSGVRYANVWWRTVWSSTSSTLTMFGGRGAGSPSSSGSTVASTSQGSSSRPSTQGQPIRIARERGSQPISVRCRVPKTRYSSPSAPATNVCSISSARWMTQSSGRTSCVAPSCQASPEPARTKYSSSDAPCECGGVGSFPGSTWTRLTPTPWVPAACPSRRQVASISPFASRRAGSSSQWTTLTRCSGLDKRDGDEHRPIVTGGRARPFFRGHSEATMKLLGKHRHEQRDDYYEERPLPDEAPQPQPEHREPRLEEPRPTDLSKRDYLAILRRAFGKFNQDH